MQTRGMRRAAVVAAALLVAVGCGTSGASSPAPTPSAATVAPPTTTQAGSADEQAALTAAVTRYLAVYSSVYSNPRQDLAIIDTVAAGEEATSLRDQAAQVAEQGVVVTGAIKLLRLTVGSVSPTPVAGGPTTANVTTCSDVSGTTATNPDGSSNLNPNRLPQTQATLQLQNPTPSDSAGWRVIQGRTGPTVPCDPAT